MAVTHEDERSKRASFPGFTSGRRYFRANAFSIVPCLAPSQSMARYKSSVLTGPRSWPRVVSANQDKVVSFEDGAQIRAAKSAMTTSRSRQAGPSIASNPSPLAMA